MIGGAGLIDVELANPLDRSQALAEKRAPASSAPSATRFEPTVPRERLLHTEGLQADLQ